METDIGDDLIYLVKLNKEQEAGLKWIRHWVNLKIGFEDDLIWLKDLTYTQMESIQLKSIPFIQRFEERKGKLFSFNGLLPEENIPSILWTPINRGLEIDLPKLNHNYFGVDAKIDLNIISSSFERPSKAVICYKEDLANYLETAPAIRLKNIKWCVKDNSEIILFGTPLLPILGETYWQENNFLIPIGFDFEFSVLKKTISKRINVNKSNWVVWESDSSYYLIPKSSLKQLSISSFRKTITKKL